MGPHICSLSYRALLLSHALYNCEVWEVLFYFWLCLSPSYCLFILIYYYSELNKAFNIMSCASTSWA